MDALHLSAQRQNGTVTVAVSGELDIATVGKLRSFVTEALDPDQPRLLIIDMVELSFIDATGLGTLIAIHHLAKRQNVEMRLARAQPGLLKLLNITRLENRFTMTEK